MQLNVYYVKLRKQQILQIVILKCTCRKTEEKKTKINKELGFNCTLFAHISAFYANWFLNKPQKWLEKYQKKKNIKFVLSLPRKSATIGFSVGPELKKKVFNTWRAHSKTKITNSRFHLFHLYLGTRPFYLHATCAYTRPKRLRTLCDFGWPRRAFVDHHHHHHTTLWASAASSINWQLYIYSS